MFIGRHQNAHIAGAVAAIVFAFARRDERYCPWAAFYHKVVLLVTGALAHVILELLL